MIVLDASAAIELISASPASALVVERIARVGETLHAPQLITLEVAQVLRRQEAAGELSAQRAAEALEDFSALALSRYPHDPLLDRIWSLRANLTAYDAAYVALAEALDAPLVTFDAKLAAAPGNEAQVEVLIR